MHIGKCTPYPKDEGNIPYRTKASRTYNIEPKASQKGPFREYDFIPKHYTYINYPWLTISCYRIPKSLTKKKITVLVIKNINSIDNKTIIYNHGFSSDLGQNFPFLIDLSSMLKWNVISYDYTVFNEFKDISLEKNLATDLESVVQYAIMEFKIIQEDILFFSSSRGSLPILQLSSYEAYNELYGIILINPISNGYYSKCKTIKIVPKYKDKKSKYDSKVLAQKINAPVFLIHGKSNKYISKEQGEFLEKNLSNVFTWYPTDGTHENLFTELRRKTYTKIISFIQSICMQRESINLCVNCVKDNNMRNSEEIGTSGNSQYEGEEEHSPNNLLKVNYKATTPGDYYLNRSNNDFEEEYENAEKNIEM